MLITIALIFILLGIAIKYGKMYFLIAGYNTMPKEEQERYDIKGIANVFKTVMFSMAFALIVGYGLAKWLEQPKIEIYTLFTTLAIGMTYLIIVSNSSKYKIKKDR